MAVWRRRGRSPNALASFSSSRSCSSSALSFCSAASAAAFTRAARSALRALAPFEGRDEGARLRDGLGRAALQVHAIKAVLVLAGAALDYRFEVLMGCSSRDERAIARVRELFANNNVSAHFFVALGAAYARGILTEESVRGNETLEDLRELYLMFEPPGNHP